MPDNANKPPRNEHELELRLVRLLGNDNSRMLAMRTMMSNAIAGQFLPKGAVLKGFCVMTNAPLFYQCSCSGD